MIKTDSKEVVLSGMLQSSALTLHNPHQLLAVLFELECQPQIVEIEPRRGIIMRGEKKIVKMRCKAQARSSLLSLQRQQNRLIIKGSYYSEYNHKIFIKNNLKGWETISKDIQTIILPIYFNFSQELSKINSESRKSQSLRSSRQMNSFQKFRESSVKKIKNSKINEDLDFIIRNEEFKKHHQSRYKENYVQKGLKSKTSPQFLQQFKKALQTNEKSKPKNNESQIAKKYWETSPVLDYSTPIKKVLSKVQTMKPTANKQQNNNRAFELIILAVIAALFLGLGEGFGNVFKY